MSALLLLHRRHHAKHHLGRRSQVLTVMHADNFILSFLASGSLRTISVLRGLHNLWYLVIQTNQDAQ